jgi:riboflavin biosynthesis pyrimidine reductase
VLAAGLIDELRTHIAPVTLGRVNASSTASRRCPGAPGRPAASLTTHISYRVLH